MQAQIQYLDFLIDPDFEGVDRLFVLLSENNAYRTSYNEYFLPTVKNKRLQWYDWLEKLFLINQQKVT